MFEKSLKYGLTDYNNHLKLLTVSSKGLHPFLHSPILHSAYSSWMKKTMAKMIDFLETTALFSNSMGLYGSLYDKSCV